MWAANQNVSSIQSVHPLKLASTRNVSILALEPVESMLNAQWLDTELFAHVWLAMEETHIDNAHLKDQSNPLNQIPATLTHVDPMPSALFWDQDQFVNVNLDILESHPTANQSVSRILIVLRTRPVSTNSVKTLAQGFVEPMHCAKW